VPPSDTPHITNCVNISQSINKFISWTHRGHGDLSSLFATLHQHHTQNCALDIYITKSHFNTPTCFRRQKTIVQHNSKSLCLQLFWC